MKLTKNKEKMAMAGRSREKEKCAYHVTIKAFDTHQTSNLVGKSFFPSNNLKIQGISGVKTSES